MSEAAFLSAICANPEEDAPRLVFADWLDEHDRPARARFVRDQVELATTDEADPRYPALLARMRRCGVLTDPAHRLESERGLWGVMFRRGFVAGLGISSASLLGSDPSRFDSLPLEQLRLDRPESDAVDEGKALAARRELARVRTLAFCRRWSVSDLEPLLTDCPHLANLRALNVEDTGEGDELRDILPRLALPNLDSLAVHLGSFSGNEDDDPDELEEPPSDDWAEYLPANLSALRRLHFDGSADDNHHWTWPGPNCNWLTRSRHWKTLEVANVRMGVDHIDTGHYVAVAPPGDLFRKLKGSRLARLMVNGRSLPGLLKVADWGAVRALAVHGEFDWVMIARLITAPQARQLEALTLAASYDERDPFPLGELPDLLRQDGLLPNLKYLSLGNLPGELLSASFCRRLTRLDVGTPGLYRPGFAPVVGAELPELRHLTVNGIRPASQLDALFTATNLPNLCTLRLANLPDLSPGALQRLADNRAMPHLSLVGTGDYGDFYKWWVLGDGEAKPGSPEVIPIDEDWWEPDPLVDWFW